MTFRRRIVKGDNVYFYDVRSYRDRETGKVRQEVKYLGKEVKREGKKVIRPPKDRYSVRRSLDSAVYIMYSTAVSHQDQGRCKEDSHACSRDDSRSWVFNSTAFGNAGNERKGGEGHHRTRG